MIYLSCTFSCPTTVAHMKALEKMLPEPIKKDIQFVLVSFDAEHDTPAAMAKHARKHGLAFPAVPPRAAGSSPRSARPQGRGGAHSL